MNAVIVCHFLDTRVVQEAVRAQKISVEKAVEKMHYGDILLTDCVFVQLGDPMDLHWLELYFEELRSWGHLRFNPVILTYDTR